MLDFFTVPCYTDAVNRKGDKNKNKLLLDAGHA